MLTSACLHAKNDKTNILIMSRHAMFTIVAQFISMLTFDLLVKSTVEAVGILQVFSNKTKYWPN